MVSEAGDNRSNTLDLEKLLLCVWSLAFITKVWILCVTVIAPPAGTGSVKLKGFEIILLDLPVTVHGFPVPSSPCLVCMRVRMCEQVSVGV